MFTEDDGINFLTPNDEPLSCPVISHCSSNNNNIEKLGILERRPGRKRMPKLKTMENN